jgi:glutamate synthase domain-containing protein 2/glutamate synthase domain-containing protein 3
VLRDLLDVKKGEKALAVDDVEPIASVVHRFCTPGISYGAISKEVHEDFAVAMNRLGAKSDSGEGGEDPARFETLENGDSKNSMIKQVASGRFGVTAYYLSRAHELEIKIAQGAKPGEGGQLPGHKVSVDIARIRHSTPGVTLISPPPHHDIYSIEDLSQLIYDLKQANPKAKVCVKLVAEDGVGTIAAGVVKAHADVILISGYDGGTGASSLSSIKHAGSPWELGLAEAQQVLIRNGLRERVILRVDGGFKTGLDVVKAALMGAEEFGFGTAALISAGCVMVRQCHLNTCPVGVATQDPLLRAKYKGTPERVIGFFSFVAQEVRLLLAEMGFTQLTDIIGRTDLLEQIPGLREHTQSKLSKINLRRFLAGPPADYRGALCHTEERNDWDGDTPFDLAVIEDARAILQSGQGPLDLAYSVRNTHRSIGTQLSHEIVNRFGPLGLPQGQIMLSLTGTVGQSFGAFAMKTLKLDLVGEANDYVGKGLSGAVMTIRPPADSCFKAEDNIICGNTCLYGATSGSLFVNGRAGERFAVRNSGAYAVVEGVGDHGCEYMTGGFVLVLGEVGSNFGAGMTGGWACVYDARQTFKSYFNPLDVVVYPMDWQSTEGPVFYDLLVQQKKMTHSALAARLLKNWQKEKDKFQFVVPKESLAKQTASQVVSKA